MEGEMVMEKSMKQRLLVYWDILILWFKSLWPFVAVLCVGILLVLALDIITSLDKDNQDRWKLLGYLFGIVIVLLATAIFFLIGLVLRSRNDTEFKTLFRQAASELNIRIETSDAITAKRRKTRVYHIVTDIDVAHSPDESDD